MKKIISFTILIIFIWGCKKENIIPDIKFLQPQNNLLIRCDTSLNFITEAKDEDGKIEKVEFLINELIVATVLQEPYQYQWNDLKLDNQGVYTIKAIVYDDKQATNTAELKVEIYDYRIKYIDEFYFTVITESWSITNPTIYDTSYYNGLIRKFIETDMENDLFASEEENIKIDEKITIEFNNNTKITSLIDTNGVLIEKYGYHYCHNGKFLDENTIEFYVGGLGGLGGGWNYKVKGVRN